MQRNINENKIIKWCNLNKNEVEFNHVYIRKIKQMEDTKLAEFNYKVLHDILPCNVNLKKWKIIESDKCNFCHEMQDIPHLLFYCKYYQNIWLLIEGALKTPIGICDVLIGTNNKEHDFAISVIAFSIYKYWLLKKDIDCSVNWQCMVKYLKLETLRLTKIYQHTKWNYLCNPLRKIISSLT